MYSSYFFLHLFGLKDKTHISAGGSVFQKHSFTSSETDLNPVKYFSLLAQAENVELNTHGVPCVLLILKISVAKSVGK